MQFVFATISTSKKMSFFGAWAEKGSRDLTHIRRRRRGRRVVKNVFLFYCGILHLFGTIRCVCSYKTCPCLIWDEYVQFQIEVRKTSRCSSRSQRRIWSFHVVVLQRTAKKWTKNYNASAQVLFCSLNLLFGDVLVAVAVVFCVRSLIILRHIDASGVDSYQQWQISQTDQQHLW